MQIARCAVIIARCLTLPVCADLRIGVMRMAEYIEREYLLEDIGASMKDSGMGYVIGQILKQYVNRQTPADVAPVRHCEWALVEKGPDRDIYRCPWCGRTIDTIFVESEVAKQFPYCHCGTKMDRGE